MQKSTWFITGTDTHIGKTWSTLALIQYFKNHGLKVAGMKPIATGCYLTPQGLRNTDAQQIMQVSGLNVPYEWVNPYAFLPPIAPHLAAKQVGQTIVIDKIVQAYQQLAVFNDVVVVEGVGGWRVPIDDTYSLREIVQCLSAQVIVVVGLRLGCINHALLTVETIIRDGCQLVGWIANPLDPYYDALATVDTLTSRIAAPLLAQFPYLQQLDINLLKIATNNLFSSAKWTV